MKKISALFTTILLLSPCTITAQTEDNEYSFDENAISITDENGNEEEIDLPESMTCDLDSLMEMYHVSTYLRADSSCNLPDYNPTYNDEDYIHRPKSLPTVMEMPYNEVVRKFIDRYSEGRLRRTISLMLGAQNFYMPIFEEALESYGLPLELRYLPIVESALNPKAVSHAGATGLWQFMLVTGKQYGLEVNSLVDDRRDPIQSSYAAAHYLSDLYRIFGDWNLVIAAYNCGPENIKKAIHRAGGSRDYWQIYPFLPRETRGYVPSFIAVNYMMNFYCDHNICPIITTLPEKTDTVVVERDVHLEQVAHVLRADIDMLRELNPQYRRDIVNGNSKPSVLRLPSRLIDSFIDYEDSIYAYRANDLLSKRHFVEVNTYTPPVVQPQRRAVSYKHSYTSTKQSRKEARSKKKKSKSADKSVTIKSGDTLSSIAKRNGTTVEKLKKLNKIKGSNIRKGAKLKVK
jgi:membrane-bound lytic murein transglycosylase D